jgi:hypothetical protein
VLAAFGLTLPGLTRILPWLVTWAAAGVMIVTVSATDFHVVRGEMSSALITLVLLVIATFVAWMRHRVLPIGAGNGGGHDGVRRRRGRVACLERCVCAAAISRRCRRGGTRAVEMSSARAVTPPVLQRRW